MLATHGRETSLLSGFVHINTALVEVPPPAPKPCGCGETLCKKHAKDPLTHRPLQIAWSLSNADAIYGQIPPMTHETKQEVLKQECMWKQREIEAGKWERICE